MRLRLIALALVAVIDVSRPARAQTEATVSGHIVDSASRQSVPFAGVTIRLQADDSVLTGVLAGENGRFVIEGLPEGAYSVQVSFAEYQTQAVSLTVHGLNNFYDLGEIGLSPVGQPVEEVVATGQRLQSGATIDSRVFRMEDNLVGSAGSLLDALRGLPGVTVDQDGRVLLRGSTQVSILVDTFSANAIPSCVPPSMIFPFHSAPGRRGENQ